MAKYQKTVKGKLGDILARLNQAIQESGASVQLVDQTRAQVEGAEVVVRVYDKYYARNGNRASLTLTLVGCGEQVLVSAISAGGGSGVFLNFSLGAEADFASIVERAMRRMGY